jgi:Deoxyribonuclease NucA/NucB
VNAVEIFRKRWSEEARLRPFHPYPNIGDEGLTLGAGTILVPMKRDRFGAPVLAVEGNEEKILALLSLGYRRRISIDALKFIKRASMQWARGEKALAHFELAYARLPRFETREDARVLFYFDGMLQLGVPPRMLMRYVGLDTHELDLLEYNRDEPRVPAGYGRESGEWTSGEVEVAQNSRLPNSRMNVPLGGYEGGVSGTSEGAGAATEIEVPVSRFGEAAQHARDAINAGKPDVLTIDRAGADLNRAAATGAIDSVPGKHLDEYPPAMFNEGGAGASVRAIDPHDNMSLGAHIGNCCRGLPNGARIKIRIGD